GRAGDVLARSSGGAEEALAAELDAVTAAIRAVKPGAPAPAPVPRPVPSSPPSPPPPPPQPLAPRADQPVPETADLVGSWTAYQRLTRGGIGAASLDELLAGGQRAASPSAALPSAEPVVLDVRTLLYRGDRALARAEELRAAAKQAAGESRPHRGHGRACDAHVPDPHRPLAAHPPRCGRRCLPRAPPVARDRDRVHGEQSPPSARRRGRPGVRGVAAAPGALLDGPRI